MDSKLAEVENRLEMAKMSLKNIMPAWNVLDRNKQSLELEIKLLTEELQHLRQGQLVFDEDF